MADIFTTADKERVNKALLSIVDVKKELNKAKLAGIDVAAQEAQLLASEQSLLAIKRVYFPGKA